MADLPKQLKNESDMAYNAFIEYCTLGALNRSHTKVRDLTGKQIGIIAGWASKYKWSQRIKEYDQQLYALQAEHHQQWVLERIREHRERYYKAATILHGLAMKQAKKLSEWLDKDNVDMTQATIGTLASALGKAADIEAHALGLHMLIKDEAINAEPDQ